MMDLREMYYQRADELAEELYSKEFYELSMELQNEVWLMAERDVIDDCADYADMRRNDR